MKNAVAVLVLVLLAYFVVTKLSETQQQSLVDAGVRAGRSLGSGLLDAVRKVFSGESSEGGGGVVFGRPKCLSDSMCVQYGEGSRCDLSTGECYGGG